MWSYSNIHSFKNKLKKNTQQVRNRSEFNLIKGIYEKPTVNIALNGERMNTFLLES